MRRHAACFVFSLVAACAVAPDGASAQSDPFYKGKRLTLLINFAAGGPADIEGRLFARHFGKHIDGTPNIIVQNRDGAGGLVGTNYLGELGPRDGTIGRLSHRRGLELRDRSRRLSRRLQHVSSSSPTSR